MTSFFVVTFSTSPKRIHKCKPMIDSILLQKPDLFLLQIPSVFERTQETYTIPDFCKDIKILITDRDYGPGTKLIPTIKYLQENKYPPQTRIVYCDDDIFYPPHMLEELRNTNPNMIWTSTGFDFQTKWLGQFKIFISRTHLKRVNVCEGFGGVCVSLGMFGNDFEAYITTCLKENILRTSDDIIFSNYFTKIGIPICIYNTPKYNSYIIRILNYGNENDALHLGADQTIDLNQKRYTESLQILKRLGIYYFSDRKEMSMMF